MDRHPVTTESDLTGDIEVAACESLAPEPGEMAPPETPCQPSNVESAERGCELSGTPCEGAIVVSKAAALCVAEENGDLTTLQGPYADLTYHSGFQVPVWNVRTVTKTGREGRGGRTFTVDATTGEFLQATFFEETP